MNEDELWEARWLALRMLAAGRTFYHERPKEKSGGWTGERVLRDIENADMTFDMTHDSAMAVCIRLLGIAGDPNELARKLQRAARRIDKASRSVAE